MRKLKDTVKSTKSNLTKIAIGKLSLDKELTSMRKVNAFFVSRYRQAYRSGANMPPIIVNRKTLKIVSGAHRWTAMMAEYPPEYEIEVVMLTFETKRELLELFIQENVTHGNALDGSTRKKLSEAILNEGATPEEIAQLFNVSVKRLEDWQGTKIIVTGPPDKPEETTEEFSKLGLHPPNGTLEREKFNISQQADRGVPFAALAQQIIRWLEWKSVERTDENLRLLKKLKAEIDKFIEQ